MKKAQATNVFAVAGYMTCSALMLLVNKLTVEVIKAPSFLLCSQLFVAALFTRSCGALGLIEVDKLEYRKAKEFCLVPIAFLGTIFANIKILQHTNVETFIVFRASTPLIISVLDYIFLGRELPSRRSWMCLLGLLFGAASYVYFDKEFNVDAYFWVFVWYVVFSFDQVYIKHACDSISMTTWGRVYYTNLMAAVPLLFTIVAHGEHELLREYEWTMPAVVSYALSCAIGTGIAYFAFLARAAISATAFTVVGNTCKALTVLLNVLMWEKHATPEGIVSLTICLVAAYLYKQAPKRQVLPTKA